MLMSLCAGLASSATIPGIVSFSGNLVFPGPPPASITAGSIQSNTNAIGIVEKISYTLAEAIPVDIVVNGPAVYDSILDLSPPGSTLAAGTKLNSYIVHFDPTNGALNFTNRNPGAIQIQFDPKSRIAGIQLSFLTMGWPSSAQLKLPGLSYAPGPLNGLELDLGDWVKVIDNQTIQLNMNSSSLAIDQVRILVATPEPSTVLLFAPAIGLLGWAVRRRSTTARNRS